MFVKAPFTTDEGEVEWMWVEVTSWRGDRIVGILLNQPDRITALVAGAQVETRQSDLSDYIHRRADGTQAGGESDRILSGR